MLSKRKSGNNIHGILLLDKRLGVSSNRALQEVKRLFNANKAGHTGSLDPLATGLLPLCFGEATKVSSLMLDDDKRYQVVVKLGVITDTGDSEGQVVAEKLVPVLSVEAIESCLKKFTGEIDQIPPMYSALKHKGRKLYELAREGKVIEREARRITIFEINLLNTTNDTLTLDVVCSKGTYIRSLAEDIGNELGCGGTVVQLRRTQAGIFKIENALMIEQLQEMDIDQLTNQLISVDKPLDNIPAILLSDAQTVMIRQGQQLQLDKKIESVLGQVRMYNEQTFLGLGEILLDGNLVPKKIFNLQSKAA